MQMEFSNTQFNKTIPKTYIEERVFVAPTPPWCKMYEFSRGNFSVNLDHWCISFVVWLAVVVVQLQSQCIHTHSRPWHSYNLHTSIHMYRALSTKQNCKKVFSFSSCSLFLKANSPHICNVYTLRAALIYSRLIMFVVALIDFFQRYFSSGMMMGFHTQSVPLFGMHT